MGAVRERGKEDDLTLCSCLLQMTKRRWRSQALLLPDKGTNGMEG